jgi:hypothetical protein
MRADGRGWQKAWSAARGGSYLEVRQVADAGPNLLVGSAEVAEHTEEFVDLAVARKERATIDHLCEYAADRPDVHGGGVVLGA